MAGALVSALAERPVPHDAVMLGEIALSGEIRPVAHLAMRLREAAKLGFRQASLPRAVGEGVSGMDVRGFARLSDLVDQMLGRD